MNSQKQYVSEGVQTDLVRDIEASKKRWNPKTEEQEVAEICEEGDGGFESFTEICKENDDLEE